MSLVLTEEQELIQQAAAEFLKERSPITHLRELRDGKDPIGFSKAIWKEMAELGWAGIPFDEDVGGAGLGLAELGVVLEECGRKPVALPLPLHRGVRRWRRRPRRKRRSEEGDSSGALQGRALPCPRVPGDRALLPVGHPDEGGRCR